MRTHHFWAKMTKLPQLIFFRKTTNIISMSLFAPFIVQNFKIILGADPELRRCTIFGPKMVHFPQTRMFWEKSLIFSSTYWLLSLWKIFLKNLQRIQSYEDAPYLGPKLPICPNKNFFRKPVNKPCSFHSCLSTFQKSNSDINLLMKHWQLKNNEISLAESHFWP